VPLYDCQAASRTLFGSGFFRRSNLNFRSFKLPSSTSRLLHQPPSPATSLPSITMLSSRVAAQAARLSAPRASMAVRTPLIRTYATAADTKPPIPMYGVDGTYASALVRGHILRVEDGHTFKDHIILELLANVYSPSGLHQQRTERLTRSAKASKLSTTSFRKMPV